MAAPCVCARPRVWSPPCAYVEPVFISSPLICPAGYICSLASVSIIGCQISRTTAVCSSCVCVCVLSRLSLRPSAGKLMPTLSARGSPSTRLIRQADEGMEKPEKPRGLGGGHGLETTQP